MAQLAVSPSSVSKASPTPADVVGKPNAPRFAELESKDSVVRYWAAKAVQVLENEELSAQGRVRIVRDIQERIAARLAVIGDIGRKTKKAQEGKSPKPAGLGCPKQMARLRESFRQFQEPTPVVEKAPVRKVHLAPRSPRGE